MPATYEPIATTTLSSSAATITFNSISSAYTDLRLIIVGRSDDTVNNTVGVFFRYNNDTGANYSRTALFGDGSAVTSVRSSGATNIFAGHLPASASGFTGFGLGQFDVFSYAGSTFKTALSNFSSDRNGAGWSWVNVGLWSSTSAITRIDFYPAAGNWAVGTTATLYGIKNA